jgi:hypothetical protein
MSFFDGLALVLMFAVAIGRFLDAGSDDDEEGNHDAC